MNQDRVWQLLGRKLAGEATMEEIRELEQLLASFPDLASGVEIHGQYFTGAGNNPETPSAADIAAWRKQLQKMQEEFPADFGIASALPAGSQTLIPVGGNSTDMQPQAARGRWKRAAVMMAAAAFLPLIIFITWRSWPAKKALLSPLVEEALSLKTSNDKIRDTLPDGSIIWLNSNSSITYNRDFGRNNRELTLRGEAFFDVVHKAELPMVVHAGPVMIRVLGTAFNVRSYENDRVEASLIRGSIELTFGRQSQRKILLRPNEKIVVRIGADTSQVLSRVPGHARNMHGYRIDTLAVESKSGLIPEVSWIENKLVFNSEPLSELAEKMERWYHVSIHIRDSVLAQEKFSGVLENETLDEALSALQLTYPFRYSSDNGHVFIYRARP